MIRIIFITHDGTQYELRCSAGTSLMRCAVEHDIPGIDADCGGNCSCGTCHVFIGGEWLSRVGQAGEEERRLLGFASGTQENSRLACQIVITETMDGLVVRLPEAQH